jgi:hypothetical protein
VKPGDKIIAIDPCNMMDYDTEQNVDALKVGKEYEVLNVSGFDFTINSELFSEHDFLNREFKLYFKHPDKEKETMKTAEEILDETLKELGYSPFNQPYPVIKAMQEYRSQSGFSVDQMRECFDAGKHLGFGQAHKRPGSINSFEEYMEKIPSGDLQQRHDELLEEAKSLRNIKALVDILIKYNDISDQQEEIKKALDKIKKQKAGI